MPQTHFWFRYRKAVKVPQGNLMSVQVLYLNQQSENQLQLIQTVKLARLEPRYVPPLLPLPALC